MTKYEIIESILKAPLDTDEDYVALARWSDYDTVAEVRAILIKDDSLDDDARAALTELFTVAYSRFREDLTTC